MMFSQFTDQSISAAGNRNKEAGVMIDTVFCFISLGIAAITTSAVFLYVGYLFLVPPSEAMLATKMRPNEATQTASAPAIPSHAVIPLLPNSAPREATQTASAPAIPSHAVIPPLPNNAPHEATPNYLTSASRLFAVYSQMGREIGITYEQYRDARMQYLQKQKTEIELQLTDTTLSTAERLRLERRKAYWGSAIQQMLALP
jgi:hypothetical protein